MKPLILTVLLLLMSVSVTHAAPPESIWITLGDEAWQLLQAKHPDLDSVSSREVPMRDVVGEGLRTERVHLVQVSESQRDDLTRVVHDELHHCAGFFAFDSYAEAVKEIQSQIQMVEPTQPAYSIDYQGVVTPMLASMSADNISNTIVSLSGFVNRYYNGSHGVAAADWLVDTWAAMAGSRSDVHIERVYRGSDLMPSVVLTIDGAEHAEQVVVVGAHLDSVNVYRGIVSHQNAVAPGADDDASGVAGLTEILRQLMASDYRPQRSIQLMAYSGEEFGLYGSKFIAADYAARDVDVVGVLQLDMTNYNGSVSDMYLIDDYTDADQNQFVEDLVDVYLPTLNVSRSLCRYACSDHASWNLRGYAASFPFEAKFGEDNPFIHSTGDTYANSGNQAKHALKFTRLGLAYVVELGEISAARIYLDGFESAGGAP